MTVNKGSHVVQQHAWVRKKRGTSDEDHLEEGDQKENPPVDGVEQDDVPLKGDQYLNNVVKDDGTQGHPYQWDDGLAELAQPEAPSIKMGAIHISRWKCGGEKGGIMCHKFSNPDDHVHHGHHTARQ